MRRIAPRSLEAALRGFAGSSGPPGLLPRAQAAWPAAAGAQVAAEAVPVAERDGIVTIACSSALWAQELELLGADLLERLNAELDARGRPSAVRALRFRTRSAGVP